MAIRKITGTLKALGPASIWGPGKGSDAGSAMYGYMRIDGQDGRGYVLENVAVRRQVGAFLDLGLNADFYMVEVRQKVMIHLLVAISAPSTKASDIEIADVLRKGMKKGAYIRFVSGACCVFIGVVFALILIGIPFLLYGAVSIYQGVRLRLVPIPTTADIKKELAAMGVVT